MNFDYLRHLLATPLEQRVALARTAVSGGSEATEYEAYFKDVFGGQIL